MTLGTFPFPQAARWLAEGTMIPFLGAGASIAGATTASALPSGKELAARLGDQIPPPAPGATWGEDWDRWELAKVAQLYEAQLDRAGLFEALSDAFCGEEGTQPSRIPTLLASIPSRKRLLMITTNYDQQVEGAFAAAGRDLAVITQLPGTRKNGIQVQVVLPGEEPDVRSSKSLDVLGTTSEDVAVLYKMHGAPEATTASERDSLVITEDDYVDYLLTSGPATAPHFPPPELLRAFQQRRFLFLGYSLADWNFRTFLRLLASRRAIGQEPGLRHWAVQLEPSEAEIRLWQQRDVTIHEGDLVTFADALAALYAGTDP